VTDPEVDAVLNAAETAEQAGQTRRAISALEDEVIELRARLAESQQSLRNLAEARARDQAPENWPPTSYGPFVVLRSLARWLVALPDLPAAQFTSVGDIGRKAAVALAFVDRVAGQPDDTALTRIGVALGLPRPAVGATWGAPEILARIAETEKTAEYKRGAAEASTPQRRAELVAAAREAWPTYATQHGRRRPVPPVRDGGNTAALIDLAVDTVLAGFGAEPVRPHLLDDLRPVFEDPAAVSEGWHDDTDEVCSDAVRWDLAWGCALWIGHTHACDVDDTPEQWQASVSMSEAERRHGFTARDITPEQVAAYARRLLALVDRHAPAPVAVSDGGAG
jgi:hypothetical protein